jgi:phosphate-selective porin OprO and OprP
MSEARRLARIEAAGGLIIGSGRAALPGSFPAQPAPNINDEIDKFRSCYRYCGAVVAICASILPVAATAQSAPTDRIDAIEQQIRKMQGELKELRNELGQAKEQLRQSRGEAQRSKEEARQAQQAAQQARQDAAIAQSQAAQAAAKATAVAAAPQAAAAAGAGGVTLTMPGGRPTISSSDGRASFAVGAQVQFDMGGYFQSPYPTTQYPNLNNGVNLRRGRIFLVGTFDDFRLNFTPDFGGSPDGTPTIYEANINYTGIKPVTATLGYFKPWFSLYDSQSSNDFLLMERPSIIEIARNLAAGDARASAGAKASWEQLFLSSYLTGGAYGAQKSSPLNGEQLGFVGRLAGRPYYDKDWNVYLGLSGEDVFHPNINTSGTQYVSQQTLTFQDRPELRIDMNNLISTGALSASGANSYGGGTGISWRNFLVQGEYYKINVDQLVVPNKASPVLGFNGGYVEGGWVITGEPIRYSVGDAAFARPNVAEPFTLGGGIGAWELSARYSATNLNSNVIPGVAQSRTGGVYGGFQQVAGVALSWYPNDWVRLYLQGQYTNVDKLNSAGTSQIGQHFFTLAGRAQVAF